MRAIAQAGPATPALVRVAAELLGTFALVFAGTAAIAVDAMTGGVLGTLGIALCFGLAVAGVITAFGDVSGAHVNPAVTLGFWVARRFESRLVLPYVLAQCSGAVAASIALRGLLGPDAVLGVTQPQFGVPAAIGFELLMSCFLMLVILGVAQGARERGLMAAVTIGGVVAVEAAVGGPVSGASMNPARSLGPALVSGEFAHLWLYLVAPLAGMLVAVPLCAAMRGPACCIGQPDERCAS